MFGEFFEVIYWLFRELSYTLRCRRLRFIISRIAACFSLAHYKYVLYALLFSKFHNLLILPCVPQCLRSLRFCSCYFCWDFSLNFLPRIVLAELESLTQSVLQIGSFLVWCDVTWWSCTYCVRLSLWKFEAILLSMKASDVAELSSQFLIKSIS